MIEDNRDAGVQIHFLRILRGEYLCHSQGFHRLEFKCDGVLCGRAVFGGSLGDGCGVDSARVKRRVGGEGQCSGVVPCQLTRNSRPVVK